MSVKPPEHENSDNAGAVRRDAEDWAQAGAVPSRVRLPVEAVVELGVDGTLLATLHCTPIDLEELAAGFLLGQGFVEQPGDIAAITVAADGSRVDVTLSGDRGLNPGRGPANRIIYSGCGQSVDGGAIASLATDPGNSRKLDPEILRDALEQVLRHGSIYRETRGVHSAGLFRSSGDALALREDIGRHNAFDKVLGWLSGQPALDTGGLFLATSGRVSAEAVRKTVRFGIPAIVSKGVPTSLAADDARRLGLTLASSLGPKRLRLYTHRYRIAR
ncbi:MAG: formate dehydrogenase accessory sulfurtransferase FdhD [Thermoleophilia bacterium]